MAKALIEIVNIALHEMKIIVVENGGSSIYISVYAKYLTLAFAGWELNWIRVSAWV